MVGQLRSAHPVHRRVIHPFAVGHNALVTTLHPFLQLAQYLRQARNALALLGIRHAHNDARAPPWSPHCRVHLLPFATDFCLDWFCNFLAQHPVRQDECIF